MLATYLGTLSFSGHSCYGQDSVPVVIGLTFLLAGRPSAWGPSQLLEAAVIARVGKMINSVWDTLS